MTDEPQLQVRDQTVREAIDDVLMNRQTDGIYPATPIATLQDHADEYGAKIVRLEQMLEAMDRHKEAISVALTSVRATQAEYQKAVKVALDNG